MKFCRSLFSRCFEALIRWHHPQRGWIPPTKFIPLAEETGLISPLSSFVFREACSQLRRWQSQFPDNFCLSININLSAIQLKQIDLVEQIKSVLGETGLSGEFLKLEITESCLLENIDAQVKLLTQLKALGMQICIDDFGTGYSSLSRLHEFPIDILKIDRAFISNMKDAGNLETVKLIVALAHSLGMNVVAEGVESNEQLRQLKTLGCEFVQGFLFSEAVDRDKASQFIARRDLWLPFREMT